ncbi:MAG TPA: hypothetical protein VHM72_08295, partial [Solirubrobacteraceae bacterium]|nr:hypothetical protein [Solirubrobacteraceae bacterium]
MAVYIAAILQRPRIGSGSDGRRRALGVLASIALATLLLPAAAGATGATSPASALLPTTPTTQPSTTSTGPPTVPAPSNSSSSGGLSSAEEIGIFVLAALIIAGIARLIISDARSHTPAGEVPDWERPRGSVRPLEQRIKQSRAKAKRARRARRT